MRARQNLHILVLQATTLVMLTAVAQRGPAVIPAHQDRTAAQSRQALPSDLQLGNTDWQVRRRAFANLIGMDAQQYDKAGAAHVASVLRGTLQRELSTAEARKLALIRLLEIENRWTSKEPKLSEEFVNYYGDVIAAVVSLNDPRSLSGLLGAISTGNMVTRALVRFGNRAVAPVAKKLMSTDPLVRSSAAATLGQMLEGSPEIANDPDSKAKIRTALLSATTDDNPWVRIRAAEGLVRLGDEKSIAAVDSLARNDPYQANFGVHKGKYLVREAAKKALEKAKLKP